MLLHSLHLRLQLQLKRQLQHQLQHRPKIKAPELATVVTVTMPETVVSWWAMVTMVETVVISLVMATMMETEVWMMGTMQVSRVGCKR
jgi:hypothetical protein